jgi:hypothetical protein
VLLKQGFIDSRLVIEAVEIGFRHQLHKILIATLVLAQNDQMVRPAARRIAILVIAFRDIHFAADDGLDPSFGCRVVEADCAEEIAVIGDGNRRHAVLGGGLCQDVVIDGTVQEAESGMQMEMYKLRHVCQLFLVAESCVFAFPTGGYPLSADCSPLTAAPVTLMNGLTISSTSPTLNGEQSALNG